MTAYWSEERGRYGTGESYEYFPKYEDGVQTFESEDGLWTCTNLESGVEILRYNGNEVHLVIPSEIKGERVISLESTFDGFTELKSVVVPEGVTSIGTAFHGCEQLEEALEYAYIPGSVKDLTEAFGDCINLKEAVMEHGVMSIGDYAFFHCTSLKELAIPESVTEFGTKAVGIMEIREYTSPEKSAFRIKGYQTVSGFQIKGKSGSKAEEYARENGIAFVQI